MHCHIVNEDKFEIKQFKNISWSKKISVEELPVELQNIKGIGENINKNNAWYCYENNEYLICAFLGNIGVEPHPLVELSCVSSWYNSSCGGAYLIGIDKKTGAFFAPVAD